MKGSAGTAVTGPRVQIPVLMYHEIAGRRDTRSRLAVSPDSFAEQLSQLRELGATSLTFAGAAAALAGDVSRVPERPVVITFDDGFADFHEEALPLLAEHGYTATVFVTTGWVADAGPLSSGRRPGRMLSWAQIRESAAAGMEIGAHSHGHPQLDQISPSALRNELVTSKGLLEDRLGSAVSTMAYPFGYSSARVRRAVREVGYASACAVGNYIASPGNDPFAVQRLTVRRSTGLQSFDVMVRGGEPGSLWKDHSLTKGWALARRTRHLLTRAVRPAEFGSGA